MAKWLEPIVTGAMPAPRKGAAAAACGRWVAMFSGASVGKDDANIVLDELCLLEVTGPGRVTCVINPAGLTGPRPAPRTGAMMAPCGATRLLLYGGFALDGKPLNDAYALDVEKLTWQCLYCGHPDLVGPTGVARQPRLLFWGEEGRAAC